jgi:CheY-like chemotaxis protein
MAAAELTPGKRALLGQHLKAADGLLKAGQFSEAEDEVQKALEIDPTNIFAKAYADRIRTALLQAQQEQAQAQAQAQTQVAPEVYTEVPAVSEEALREYQLRLENVWEDGQKSPEEENMLVELRVRLGIPEEVHQKMEKKTQIDAYLHAIKAAWHEGESIDTAAAGLEDLRKKYLITVEEHLGLEGRILFELRADRSKGKILVVDDDKELLWLIRNTLSDEGYLVVTATSVEEAMDILSSSIPDLILSDINFPKPGIGGFTFYERLRKDNRFVNVPFLFLSGMDDEMVVRTGRKMGVDEYLVKPLEPEALLASIEGKLRRYRELRQAFKDSKH